MMKIMHATKTMKIQNHKKENMEDIQHHTTTTHGFAYTRRNRYIYRSYIDFRWDEKSNHLYHPIVLLIEEKMILQVMREKLVLIWKLDAL